MAGYVLFGVSKSAPDVKSESLPLKKIYHMELSFLLKRMKWI